MLLRPFEQEAGLAHPPPAVDDDQPALLRGRDAVETGELFLAVDEEHYADQHNAVRHKRQSAGGHSCQVSTSRSLSALKEWLSRRRIDDAQPLEVGFEEAAVPAQQRFGLTLCVGTDQEVGHDSVPFAAVRRSAVLLPEPSGQLSRVLPQGLVDHP